MYVATVPNRNSPPAILLRESFRLGGKVRNRTLSNLSHWPPAQLDALRSVLKGATSIGAPLPQAFDIVRSRPHGHVAPGPTRRPPLCLEGRPFHRRSSAASLRYRPLPPAWPRGRGPRHLAPPASRPAHRHPGQPRTRFGRGPDRGPRSRTSLQAGHFARPASGYSQQHFGGAAASRLPFRG